jgi:hypothetical protein
MAGAIRDSEQWCTGSRKRDSGIRIDTEREAVGLIAR